MNMFITNCTIPLSIFPLFFGYLENNWPYFKKQKMKSYCSCSFQNKMDKLKFIFLKFYQIPILTFNFLNYLSATSKEISNG